MGELLLKTLGFSTELLSECAARFGKTQVISREAVSRLKPSNSIAKAFLPKAKSPNIKWSYSKNQSSQTIHFTFMDGEMARTSGNFTAMSEGRINYDFNFVNSGTGKQTASTKGFYDPNQPLFSTKQHGAGYDWKDGQLTIHTHSSGFSNDTTTDKEFLGDVAKQIKNFLSNVFTKERIGQMFSSGEVVV